MELNLLKDIVILLALSVVVLFYAHRRMRIGWDLLAVFVLFMGVDLGADRSPRVESVGTGALSYLGDVGLRFFLPRSTSNLPSRLLA